MFLHSQRDHHSKNNKRRSRVNNQNKFAFSLTSKVQEPSAFHSESSKQVPRSWITSTRLQAEISKLAWPRRSHPPRSTRVYNVLAYFYADYFDAGTPAPRPSAPKCQDCDRIFKPCVQTVSVADFVRKWIISGVRVQAGLHLDMLDADRSPNMQSAFLPELHRWISKLIARHLHACPPGDLLITMVKETVILYEKEFRNMKKKSYLSLIWKRWKREMTARLPVTVSSVQTWFYM